jgi:hypothetical protein
LVSGYDVWTHHGEIIH